MDASTETLLIILVSIISILVIAVLTALVAFLIVLNRLASKLKFISENASETLVELRQKIAKPAGLFIAVKFIYKLLKR